MNGLLNIKTWGDLRNLLHVALPGLSVLIVGTGVVDESIATAAVGVALAATSPLLGVLNTPENKRKYLYGLVLATASAGILLGYFTSEDWANWAAVFAVLFGGGVATANTQVSNGTVEK